MSEKDLPEIKAFYQELINDFARKDLDKIWTITKPAWEEWAIADNNSSRVFFDSVGFKEKFDSGNYVTRIMPEWKNFRLVSYKGGRIFRLEEGSFGNSPIQLDNKVTGKTAVYNPYLSIINGKIFISR